MMRTVGILLFDGVELLDFCGPMEVFTACNEVQASPAFRVITLSVDGGRVVTHNGLTVLADMDISYHPLLDVLVLPGGEGSRRASTDANLLEWVNRVHLSTETTMTVCSGVRFALNAGWLENAPFCTHHTVYAEIEAACPSATACRTKRFVQHGKLFTSAGVAAGMDLSIHLVGMLVSKAASRRTAAYMELGKDGADGARNDAQVGGK
jgi:transcriptional regulator GlxA family with amidase domain